MKPALREERLGLSEKTECCFLPEFLKAMTALTAILDHSNIPKLFVHWLFARFEKISFTSGNMKRFLVKLQTSYSFLE